MLKSEYLCSMAQVRLRNATGSTPRVGDLVRINPKDNSSFIKVTDLSTLPVIGTVATPAPNGNTCLIDLLNSVGSQIVVSPNAPTNPAIGTIWIDSSN
jgi:hypothetical protein